jgi:cardiolipin synthase
MSPAPPLPFFTLPNLLSLARLPLGLGFWLALGPTPAHPGPAFGVIAAAAVTDVLDGHLARRRGADVAGAGSWLDPICDKVFVAAVLAALHVERRIPLDTLALVVARELLQLPMVLVYRAIPILRSWLHYDFRASVLGKAATVTQFLAIAALILGWPARALVYSAFALGVIALGDYIRRAIAIGRRRAHTQAEPRPS